MEITKQKAALRQKTKALAAAFSLEDRRQAGALICRYLLLLPELTAADTVLAFYPAPEEPAILPVLEELLARGKRLALPRCLAPGVMEARQVDGLTGLAPGRYGIPEPGAERPLVLWDDLSFAILPCVTADRSGNRLGHGGGYYDRFLAAAPRGMGAAVVCYAALMPRQVPTQPHDIPIPLVVTEEGIWRAGQLTEK